MSTSSSENVLLRYFKKRRLNVCTVGGPGFAPKDWEFCPPEMAA
jgi:hypothetical protein